MANIMIYSKATCPYCNRAKDLFKDKDLNFTEYMVDQDPERLQEMLSLSGGKRTVPQIFINEQHVWRL